MLGYTWWHIFHGVYKEYRLTRAVLFFDYSLKHTLGALIGTCVLTQNLPASIFQANKFVHTRRAKHE